MTELNNQINQSIIDFKEPPKEPKLWKQVRDNINNGNMNGRTLYVTSFNKPMYKMSGKYLIETFTKLNPKDYLVVCYEDMDFNRETHQLLPYDLKNSGFLHSWLKENEKDIPEAYGGLATKENNPALYASYFNKASSKWFRKIVSIDHAIKIYGSFFEYVVWLDADCYARSPISPKIIDTIFGKNDVIYHLGIKRRNQKLGIESGIFGFRKGRGYQYMDIVSDKYKSGQFKQYTRWDDGWVFREVVDEEAIKNTKKINKDKIRMLDLVGTIPEKNIKKSEVIPHGPFRNFFVHDKGKHNALRGAKVKKVKFNTL